MKRLVKKSIMLFLASFMTLSLVACGGEETSDTAESTTDESNSEESSDEPITLSFTWWGSQQRHEYTQELLDLYSEENPNITIQGLPSGWDGYFDKLSTQAASGAMPDIIQMDYLYISTYAKNNSITDLQPYIDNNVIDTENIPESILNTGIIDDKMAGIAASSTAMNFTYNPDVLKANGFEEPTSEWTWSDFISMNQTVAANIGSPSATFSPVDSTNLLNYWVRQHGYELFSDDNLTLGYDDDQITADYIQMWADLMDEGAVANPDEYEAIKALGEEGNPVVLGDAAMKQGWVSSAITVADVNPNINLVTPPLLDGGESDGLWIKPGMFMTVADTSEHKEESAAFVDWFINSEEANDLIVAERGIPVSSKVIEHLTSSGNLSEQQMEAFEFIKQATLISGDTPKPEPAGISEINQLFMDTSYKVFYGQNTSMEAASEFRTGVEEILARNN